MLFMEENVKKLCQVAQAIYDKKGFNILGIDVKNLSSMTDYFLIAEGNVDRHVRALAETIIKELEIQGFSPLHLEGMREGDWVILDYLDFVIHLLTPEFREKYALEQLWQKGRVLDLMISPSDVNSKL